MTDEKHIVTEYLLRDTVDEIDGPLLGLVARLNDMVANIPAEFRDKATVETDFDYDGGTPNIAISYPRPETDGERKARVEDHNRYVAEVEAREKAQLASLKRKYE